MKLPKWKEFSVFTRLILLYSIVIFLTVSVITVISMRNSFQSTEERISERSNTILGQFQDSIDTYAIEATNTFIASFIAREPSVAKLMNTPLDNNLALVADVHEKLLSYMFTSSLYNSIYVYSADNAVAVSNTGSYFLKNGKYANESIDWLVDDSFKMGSHAALMPDFIAHPLISETNRSDVITCYRGYPLSSQDAIGKGIIAVNLNVYTLYQQYSLTDEPSGELFIVSADGRVMVRDGDPFGFLAYAGEPFLGDIAEGKPSGFSTQIGDKPYRVFYVGSRMGDWRYAYTVPNDMYYEETSAILQMGLLIAVLTITLPILATLLISKKVYHPIRALVSQSARLSEELTGQSHGSHEANIGTTLNALSAKVGTLQQQMSTFEPELKITLLNRLLLQKNVGEEELATRLAQLSLTLLYPYFACVHIAIKDGPADVARSTDGRAVSMAYNVCQFIENIDADNCIRLATDMLTEGILVFINTDTLETIPALCGAVMDYCQYRLQVRAVIGVGRPRTELTRVNRSYAEAVGASRYRFVHPDQAIFWAEETVRLDESPLKPDMALLDRLEKTVGGKQPEAALEASAQVMDTLRREPYAYDTVQDTLLSVLRILSRSKNQFMLRSDDIFDGRLNNLFFAADDINDFEGMITYLIERLFALRLVEEANKPAMEIEKIKRHVQERIESHQPDEVTLSAVAAALHRNPNYLSTMFSDYTGTRFKDFVMDTKLEHARAQLHVPGAKVYQIAGDLGYFNVSYFIRIFKQKYGVTPKQYYESMQEREKKDGAQEE